MPNATSRSLTRLRRIRDDNGGACHVATAGRQDAERTAVTAMMAEPVGRHDPACRKPGDRRPIAGSPRWDGLQCPIPAPPPFSAESPVKSQLRALIDQGIANLRAQGTLPADLAAPDFVVERPKDRSHGDFATNVAMTLAKPARSNPRAVAQALIDALPANDDIAAVEIAGPGFLNFRLSPAAWQRQLRAVHANGAHYLTPEVARYRRHVAALCYGACMVTGRYVLHVHLSPPDARARDMDNAIKSIGDALVRAGWLPDDSMAYMRELHVTVDDARNASATVRVVPLDDPKEAA